MIEDLFLHPKIWRGRRGAVRAVLPTGFDVLDRYLPGGGWPREAVTEIFVDRYGVGELTLLMPALAFLSRSEAGADQWLVWVAPPFIPYAPALVRCGIDLDRLLLVHPLGNAKKTLWAAEQAVRSKSCAAALIWLPAANDKALRRLQLGVEAQKCWTVLFRPSPALERSSPAALRLRLSPSGSKTSASKTRVEIIKCRGARPAVLNVDLEQ